MGGLSFDEIIALFVFFIQLTAERRNQLNAVFITSIRSSTLRDVIWWPVSCIHDFKASCRYGLIPSRFRSITHGLKALALNSFHLPTIVIIRSAEEIG